MPWAPPVTIATRPGRPSASDCGASPPIGENGAGIRIRLCCHLDDQRPHLRHERLPAGVGDQVAPGGARARRAPRSPRGGRPGSASPTSLGHEPPDDVARGSAPGWRGPPPRRAAGTRGTLPTCSVYSAPPRSPVDPSHRQVLHLEPLVDAVASIPRGRCPDSLTPPNGATSVETKPVLMPTMPYSSASDTRQMRPVVAAVEVGRRARRACRSRAAPPRPRRRSG